MDKVYIAPIPNATIFKAVIERLEALGVKKMELPYVYSPDVTYLVANRGYVGIGIDEAPEGSYSWEEALMWDRLPNGWVKAHDVRIVLEVIRGYAVGAEKNGSYSSLIGAIDSIIESYKK